MSVTTSAVMSFDGERAIVIDRYESPCDRSRAHCPPGWWMRWLRMRELAVTP
jgi:hypothetical protein